MTPAELQGWIISETEDLLVVNKRAHVVCHPSKHGAWSSLVSACREYCGSERLHLVSRLDRETSGVVVLARNPATASRLQRAMQAREAMKTYLAILEGEVRQAFNVDLPVGPDPNSTFVARQWAVTNGKLCGDALRTVDQRHWIYAGSRHSGDRKAAPDQSTCRGSGTPNCGR